MAVVIAAAAWTLAPGDASATSCAIATISWDGGAGTTDWGTAINWDLNRLPTTTDHVCIDGSSPGSAVTLTSSASVLSVDVHKPLTISGSLTVGSAEHESTITGGLTMTGGSLTGAGSRTISGPVAWTGGSISGTGITTIPAPVTVAVSGSSTKSIGGPIVLDGQMTVEGTGTLNFGSSGQVTNNGLIDLRGDATLNHSGGATLINTSTGRLLKSAGVTSAVGVPVDNDGVIEASTGKITLGGGTPTGSASSGSYQADGSASVRFIGGTHTMDPGATAAGSGRVVMVGGTLMTPFTVPDGATLRWEGGTLAGTAGLVVAPTGRIDVAGGSTKSLGTQIRNAGTVTVTGTGSMSFTTSVSGAALGELLNTGTIDLASDATLVLNLSAAVGVTNRSGGVITKSAGINSEIGVPILNDGTLAPAVGTIELSRGSGGRTSVGAFSPGTGAKVRISGSGTTFLVGSGVTFNGPGTIQFAAGTLDGPAWIRTGATLDWTGGTWRGPDTGFAVVQAGATVRVPVTPIARYLQGRVRNLGTMEVSGTFGFYNDATLQNEGTIEVQDAGRVTCCFGSTAVRRLLNRAAGTIVHTGTAESVGTIDVPLDNDGVTTSNGGTLNLTGGNPPAQGSVGAYVADAGASLHFGGGTHLLGVGSTISGPGTPVVTAGAVLGRGRIVGGTILDLRGGTLGGESGGAFQLTVDPDAVVDVQTGAATPTIGYRVRNEGIIRVSTAVALTADTVLTNAGTIDVVDAGALGTITGQGQVLNVRRSLLTHTGSPDSVASVRAPVQNIGTITSEAGELQLHGGTGAGLASTGFHRASADAVLSFRAGTHLLNGARFRGPGTVEVRGATISGPWLLTRFGRLELWSGELAAGPAETPSRIAYGGTLTVPGTAGWMSGVITNEGAVSIPGRVQLKASSVLQNLATVEVVNGGSIGAVTSPYGVVENYATGVVTKTGEALTVGRIEAHVDNDGLVEVGSGELELRRGTGVDRSSSGVYAAAAGQRLELETESCSGCAHKLEAGSRFRGAGHVAVTGDVRGPWTVEDGATLDLEAGSLTYGGTGAEVALIASGGQVTVDVPENNSTPTVYDNVRNEGLIAVRGDVNVRSSLVNAGTMELIDAGKVSGSSGQVVNETTGLITKTGARSSVSEFAAYLDNDGVVRAESGELRLTSGTGSGGQASSGEYTTTGAALVVFTSYYSPTTVEQGAVVSGRVHINGGNLSGPLLIDHGGSLSVLGGLLAGPTDGVAELVVGPAGSLHRPASSGNVWWTGGIRNDGLIRIDGSLSGSEMVLTNNEVLELGGTASVQYCSCVRNLINGPAGQVNVSDGRVRIDTAFDNQGTVAVGAGAELVMSQLVNYASKTLTGGAWRIAGQIAFENGGGAFYAAVETNAADLELTGPQAAIVDGFGVDMAPYLMANAGTLTITDRDLTLGAFTNDGQMTVGPDASVTVPSFSQRAGVLSLDPTATVTPTDPAGFVLAGGELRGAGTIAGPVTNTGTSPPVALAPGAELNVDSYTQQPGGLFHVELSNTGTGTAQQQILATGPGTLAGTLRIRTSSSFVPVVGDKYVLGTFAVRNGQFGGLDVQAPAGFAFQPFYTPTTFGVSVVASP